MARYARLLRSKCSVWERGATSFRCAKNRAKVSTCISRQPCLIGRGPAELESIDACARDVSNALVRVQLPSRSEKMTRTFLRVVNNQ